MLSMGKSYGVALLGCGHMGEAHISEIYAMEDVRMEFVCDLDRERAELFRRRYGVRRTTDKYLEAIASPDVDIVICATSAPTHLEILRQCVKHSKHLLCEKPVAVNWEDGEAFAQIVRENPQIKVLIGHILRHNTTWEKVADMIRGGAVGGPVVFRMSQNHHTMNWPKYRSLVQMTSPFLECGVHYVDVMEWFTGAQVTDVQAIGARTEPDLPENCINYALMTVKLSDGSTGFYEAGWSNSICSSNMKEFFGPRGSIRLIYAEHRFEHAEEGDLIEYYKYPEREYATINVPSKRKPTDRQFRYLLSMIEDGAEAVPSIDSVMESFRVCLEADRKAGAREVHIPFP